MYRTTLPSVAALDVTDLLTDAAGRPRIEEYLIQQSRLGNQKNTQAALSKTTAAEENVVVWTVTNGKTGYLSKAFVSIKSHASETTHILKLVVDTTEVTNMEFGQGDRLIDLIFPLPHKLAGDGSKTITIKVQQGTTNQSTYRANLLGWEE